GCQLLAAGSHPDITRVEPEEPGKPIKVDRVRQLCAFLGQTARGYKVALLSPAEAMNPSAANALLKTLEEPPPGSLLLLVTAFPARLPATIRSRCQILAFTPPLRTQALEWLSPRVAGFQAGLLLDLTGNAPLAALEQADRTRLQRRRELLKILVEVADRQLDPIDAAETWSRGEVVENLHWLVQWHMDLIRLKAAESPPGLRHSDLAPQLRALGRRVPLQTLFRRLEQARDLERLAATAVNLPLQLEGFLMEWAGD
ncbi:MAG: DNA polymerase III subunit delta' C-terminal domain-containing protein, partial [Candidatus Competibacteraceae bacterium]|nr:DNA polymerase III subunit delta' C-terminal domain-containing protein [Candidatus Competibacteraceae bacterium]